MRSWLVMCAFAAGCGSSAVPSIDAGAGVTDAGPSDAAVSDGGAPPIDAGSDAGRDAFVEPCTRMIYRDADGDGFGDPTNAMVSCVNIVGYLSNADDCFDGNVDARPGQTEYFEADRGDGSFDYDCDSNESPLYPDVGMCPDTSVVPPRRGTPGWELTVPTCGGAGYYKSLEASCAFILVVSQVCR